MFSLAYSISVLFALVALSRTEEAVHGTDSNIESKYYYGPASAFSFNGGYFMSARGYFSSYLGSSNYFSTFSSVYSAAYYQNQYNRLYFAKVDGPKSVSRRAISLDADQLYRRATDESITCHDQKGVAHQVLKEDCNKAAQKLVDDHLSASHCMTCALSLVTRKDKVAFKKEKVNLFELNAAVDGLLKTCSTSTTGNAEAPVTSSSKGEQDIALVLHKGNGAKC